MLAAGLAAIGLGGFGCASVQNEGAIKEAALNDFKQSPTYPPVILTENTHASLKTLAHMTYLYNTLNFGGGAQDVKPQIITDGIRQSLSARFPQYGAPPRSGLVMVFDAQTKLGGHSFAKTTLKLSGTFKDGDQVIDTVTGDGSAKIPWPASNCGFSRAAQAAFAQFNENLQTAPGLIAYLSAKPKEPAGNPASPRPNNSASASPAPAEPTQNPAGQIDGDVPNSTAPRPPPAGQGGNSVYTLLPSTPTTTAAAANPGPEGH